MVRFLLCLTLAFLRHFAFAQTSIDALVLLNERGYSIINGIGQIADSSISCKKQIIPCNSPCLSAYELVSIKSITIDGISKELDVPYVVAINKETLECFKLSGFEQNDIVYFLQNVKEINGLVKKSLSQIAEDCSEGTIDYGAILKVFTDPKYEYQCHKPFRYWTILRRVKDTPTPYVY